MVQLFLNFAGKLRYMLSMILVGYVTVIMITIVKSNRFKSVLNYGILYMKCTRSKKSGVERNL